jgi:hypothetical protein
MYNRIRNRAKNKLEYYRVNKDNLELSEIIKVKVDRKDGMVQRILRIFNY